MTLFFCEKHVSAQKRKLLVAVYFVAFLLLLFQVPFVSSSEQDAIVDKALTFIKDIARIDVSKYNVSHTDVNSYNLPTHDDIPTQTIKYTLNSTESELEILLRFLNGTFTSYQLYLYKGSPICTQTFTDVTTAIKSVFERYQTFSDFFCPEDMYSLLSGLSSDGNISQVLNNVKIEADIQENSASIRCFYTENGVDYLRKGLSMTFESGVLMNFGDEWSIYTIGDTVPAVSKDEALKAAIDAANNYTLQIGTGSDNAYEEFSFEIDPEHIEIELNPVEREPLTLQLMWSSRLYFKEPVHFVYCIVVQQWADTGEIKYVAPVSGGGSSPESEPTQSTQETNQNSQPPTQLLFIAATIGLITAVFAVTVFHLKKRKRN